MNKLSILVEGWRGINHSYALVNQYQLLELKKQDVDLFHKDAPFIYSHWNTQKNYSGLGLDEHEALEAIPSMDAGKTPDIIYRISSLYNYADAKAQKIFVFGPPEFQSIKGLFFGATLGEAIANEKLQIVTPSKWSSHAFLKNGFSKERVHIVTHGVDPKLFHIENESIRDRFRSKLGLKPDDFALLSISALTWNKGTDLLIEAYAKLKPKMKNLKLIIKDQNNVYGLQGKDFLGKINKSAKFDLSEETLSSIVFVTGNLSLAQIRELYSACDCYVSPYRAEGFNLPPLEAAACGLKSIVTKGGSTDDYFSDLTGKQVESIVRTMDDGRAYLEPNIDDLMAKIEFSALNPTSTHDKNQLSSQIHDKYSWEKVSKRLLDVFKAV
ncbi:glycosyltransferase family 4 protein [Polynucleobacter paneuropaeus]|nr:glycosyltransferase family 4 protein [Polynucleobacter paneuropaeus]